MRSTGIASRIVLSLVLIALSPLELPAQVTTADVTGTVTDASGAVVEGVKVTAENLATRAARSAVSDSTGNFLIPLLPIGRYSLRAEKTGFRAWSVPEVSLAVGDRLRADVHLEVGAIEQVVEVTGQTAALQSETSNLGTLVNSSFVADLPLNGRNFIRLAQVAAGANEGNPNSLSSGNRPDDRRRTSSVNVNGQQSVFNNFLIDGMDNNERSIGSIVVKPAMDALAEFKVQTNLYAAELGRTAGGVINLVTKSGSNELHGTLYEYLRNDKVDAKNFFDRPGKIPELRQNQFGGSVGGPIIKNKVFFFGDYEGFRLRSGQTFVSTVPTLAMRTGNFAGLNTIFDPLNQRPDPNNPNGVIRMPFPMNRIPVESQDPVAQRLLALYPAPQTSGLANNFTNTPTKSQDDDTVDTRFDFNLSASNALFARYTFNDTTSFLPPHLPKAGDIDAGGEPNQFSGPALQRAQGVHLNYVHTFSPNLIGEFKAGYARFALQTVPVNYGNNVSQQLGIINGNVGPNASGLTPMEVIGFRGLGSSIFLPIIVFNNTFQYVGNLTWVHSGHTVKTGVDYRRRQFTVSQNP